MTSPPLPLSLSDLRSHLQQKLPDYMVPNAFVVLDALPLTPNGKLDRKALPKPDRASAPNAYAPPRTPTERILTTIYQEILKVNPIGIHDNFFELGGHSLLLFQMKYRIEQSLTLELAINLFFKYPTPATLGAQLDRLCVHPAHDKNAEPQTRSAWCAEMSLDASIHPPTNGTILPFESPGAIFITGATGFLGAYLLHDLLQVTSAPIYCLMRATNTQEAEQRLQRTLEQYALWQDRFRTRLVPVLGDLAQPRFGLSPAEFDQLAACIDVIYHNGANVNFVYSYSNVKSCQCIEHSGSLASSLSNQVKSGALYLDLECISWLDEGL